MKKLTIVFLAICLPYFSFSQDANTERLALLPGLIEEALKNSDYQKAADLKKEKETREKIKEAIKAEDYAKAAELNKALANGSNPPAQVNSSAYTPNTSSAPEPEFMNQVAYWNEAGNKLVLLEEAKPELKTSSWGAPGYSQATSSHVLMGEHSSITFKSSAPQVFIVRFPETINPKDQFRLVKFEVRGRKAKDRYCEAYTFAAGGFGAGGGGQSNKQNVAITFTKVKPGFYKITPDVRLEPGEYAFDHLTMKMFAFRIE